MKRLGQCLAFGKQETNVSRPHHSDRLSPAPAVPLPQSAHPPGPSPSLFPSLRTTLHVSSRGTQNPGPFMPPPLPPSFTQSRVGQEHRLGARLLGSGLALPPASWEAENHGLSSSFYSSAERGWQDSPRGILWGLNELHVCEALSTGPACDQDSVWVDVITIVIRCWGERGRRKRQLSVSDQEVLVQRAPAPPLPMPLDLRGQKP